MHSGHSLEKRVIHKHGIKSYKQGLRNWYFTKQTNAAKGELVVEQEKSAVYVKEVKEFNHDNEGIEELIKFLGEYKEGIIEELEYITSTYTKN